MTITIDAIYVKGLDAAHRNIKFQIPHLVLDFPEIEKIFPGTINVKLNSPLWILEADHTTPFLPWWDVGRGEFIREQFSFVRIEFEYPLGAPRKTAWFYIPHGSPYRFDPFTFEIITECQSARKFGSDAILVQSDVRLERRSAEPEANRSFLDHTSAV